MKRMVLRPVLAGVIFATAAAAGAQAVNALGALRPGLWAIHEIGVRGSRRAICVRDPALLFQIEHSTASCRRTVISDGPRGATVRYSCPGAGSGQTVVTVETPELVRLQTQGVKGGAPFDLDYEARREGSCPRA